VIGADGVIRWIGDPVARLLGTEHIMRPRVLLLADEQLTGNARDHVAARVERFVNHHISTVLKPLDDLSRADQTCRAWPRASRSSWWKISAFCSAAT
jgi:ATP-dependent RNA helicase SUPV3L1/SUV3